MRRLKVSAFGLLLAGTLGCRTAPVRPPSEFPYPDDISFRGFAEEVLLGHGTPRTHRFNDYTKASYHVDPREVVEGVFRIAPLYKRQVKAVAVIGAYGVLWAFDVISVIAEENCTRVNWLVMPHARITLKRSGCAAPDTVSSLLAELRSVTPLAAPASDSGSCLVISEGVEPRWSAFGCYSGRSGELDGLESALNRIMTSLTVTYSAFYE